MGKKWYAGIAACLLAAPLLMAQSYQTTFGAISFDRGKSPVTLHGATDVETGSGALGLTVPLGPGLGARGAKWDPTLRGRWAPTLAGTSSRILNANTFSTDTFTTYNGGFALTPGFLKLWIEDYAPDPESGLVKNPGPIDAFSHFTLPSGEAGSFLARGTSVSNLPAGTDLQAIADSFGFTVASGWRIAPPIGDGPTPPAGSFAALSGKDEIIIGLYKAQEAEPAICIPWKSPLSTQRTSDAYCPRFPSRILVVSKDTAYEYIYRTPRYASASDGCKYCDKYLYFKWAAFGLKSIRNRQGDAISFSYDLSAATYTARWLHRDWATDTGNSIVVTGPPAIGIYDLQTTTVRYQGTGSQPSFQLEGIRRVAPYNPDDATGALVGFEHGAGYDGFQERALDTITDLGTGQKIRLQYQKPLTDGVVDTTILSSITCDGRYTGFGWMRYEYFNNDPRIPGYAHSHYFTDPGHTEVLPQYVFGVCSIVDMDTSLDPGNPKATRMTAHERVIPKPNLKNMDYWLATAHYDLVTHPDGSATLTRFAEPVNDGRQGRPDKGASDQTQIQALAALKHQVVEVRHYDNQAQARADILSSSPAPGAAYLKPLASSAAYAVELSDGFDLRGVGNPDGLVTDRSVPYPTHHRSWDRDTSVLRESVQDGWITGTNAWSQTLSLEDVAAAPTANQDLRSCLRQGVSVSLPNPAAGRLEVEIRGYANDISRWAWNRVSQTTRKVLADNGAGHDTAISTGLTEPVQTITYETEGAPAATGRIKAATRGTLSTEFRYGSGTPQASFLPVGVDVGFTGSPDRPVGITAFTYDSSTGYLTTIQPKGATWTRGQDSDAFGSAMGQTDENGLRTQFTWDAGRRLTGIQPPGREVATTIQYVDAQHLIVYRGADQKAEQFFNGFGEPVLERRYVGTVASHRIQSYDWMGRRVVQSVWLPGEGKPGDWAAPNLTCAALVDASSTSGDSAAQSTTDTDPDGSVRVISYDPDPPTTLIRLEAMLNHFSGTTYDTRGRVLATVDPNDQKTTITYAGLTRTVTQGPGTTAARSTRFMSDSSGRLWQVIDALGQPTTYAYDRAKRLTKAIQADPASGLTQVRTWSYDEMGNLLSLTQPESGTTTYADFDVNGKPWTTTYGVGSALPRVVRSTFDALGRLATRKADDGSVAETYTYGPSAGVSTGADPLYGYANNRLVCATSSGITRKMSYWELNGRLSALSYAVDGNSFDQTFTYDAYGHLRTRTYPDGRIVSITYDNARDLATQTTSFLGGNQANLALLTLDDTTWQPNSMTLSYGVVTSLTYGNDQTRLAAMSVSRRFVCMTTPPCA